MSKHSPEELLEIFTEVAGLVDKSIQKVENWGPSGKRPGQYNIDVSADEVAIEALLDAGLGVLSEESGLSCAQRPTLAVIDPIDGSTNAAMGLPWFATSICALDKDGMSAALVVNQATKQTYSAIAGQGAWCDGHRIKCCQTATLSEAIVATSGLAPHHMGWKQFRCYGAAALDMCRVADGSWDAFIDMSHDAHGVWDYLAATLICREAGAVVGERYDRDLIVKDPTLRRTPIAAATPELYQQIVAEFDK